jgi:hypothetical protein
MRLIISVGSRNLTILQMQPFIPSHYIFLIIVNPNRCVYLTKVCSIGEFLNPDFFFFLKKLN